MAAPGLDAASLVKSLAKAMRGDISAEERAKYQKEAERSRERRPDRMASSDGPRKSGARPRRASGRRRRESALQEERPRTEEET